MFQQCKSPITSMGVIAFRCKDKRLEYLMICRKDSLGYVDFVRGKYPIHDKSHLRNIFGEMTVEEKHSLLTKCFDEMWEGLWGRDIGIQYRGEEKCARSKFEKLRCGVATDDGVHSIATLIRDTPVVWGEPEWGFPKGRRNYHEKDITCAMREFEEETGYSRDLLTLVQNVQPAEEIFTGSNFKSYRHRYFLAMMRPDAIQSRECQKSEVSKMQWMPFDECIAQIRPYNQEKRSMLQGVSDTLARFSLYS